MCIHSLQSTDQQKSTLQMCTDKEKIFQNIDCMSSEKAQ